MFFLQQPFKITMVYTLVWDKNLLNETFEFQ